MGSPKLSYEEVKENVFGLPLSQRIKLFEELKETDIKSMAKQAFNELANIAKKKKFTSKDIDEIIHKIRKNK